MAADASLLPCPVNIPLASCVLTSCELKSPKCARRNTALRTSTCRYWINSMHRKNFFLAFALLALLSTATQAQVPGKEKVVAGAERAFEKLTKAYSGPAPGCAAA